MALDKKAMSTVFELLDNLPKSVSSEKKADLFQKITLIPKYYRVRTICKNVFEEKKLGINKLNMALQAIECHSQGMTIEQTNCSGSRT